MGEIYFYSLLLALVGGRPRITLVQVKVFWCAAKSCLAFNMQTVV